MSAALALTNSEFHAPAATLAPYCDPPLPTLEVIAALPALPNPEDRPIYDVLTELNKALLDAGLEFGENEFGDFTRHEEDPAKHLFSDYRWVECSAVRGGNEGYYIHLWLHSNRHDIKPARMIASGKTWTWASALAIAAATTALLRNA